jgi:PAS domain S-box-containing protein
LNGSILDAWTTRGLLGAVGKSSGTQAKRRVLTSHCYRLAFNDSGVPMAIATMDGCFVDCNKSFLRTTSYTMDELMKLTIFNLTAPSDLQQTFSKVSQMIRSTVDMPYFETRALLNFNRERGNLAISLVRDDHRRPIYFSVCFVDA